MTAHWSEALRELGACREARGWAATQPSLEAAWHACEQPGWLAWLVARLDPRLGVALACLAARSVLLAVPAGEERPQRAIEAAEAWLCGATYAAGLRAPIHGAFAYTADAHAAAASYAAAAASDAAAVAAAAYASRSPDAYVEAAAAYAAVAVMTAATNQDDEAFCALIRLAVPCPVLPRPNDGRTLQAVRP